MADGPDMPSLDGVANADDLHAFLDAHPEVRTVDLFFTGLSGVPRGKRLRRPELAAGFEYGRFLP